MAVFATTMAVSMVGGVVNTLTQNLSSTIVEELGVVANVRREIRYIKEEFEIMKAYLLWAEEQETSVVARTWVKQVRELALDVEDCVDEFALRLEQQRKSSLLGAVLHQYSLSLRARNQIATEIQEIKFRVHDLSERRLRYGLNGTAQGSSSSSSDTADTAASRVEYDPREAFLISFDDTKLVGLETPGNELIDWLLDGSTPRLAIVSVVGMGGLGKTTLAKMVYESPRVTGGHFNWCAWISVSQRFEKTRFLISMFKKLFPDSSDRNDEDQLIDKIRGELRQKRYLIVFDDIWTIDSWESIKLVLPDVDNGSRVVVTTRDERVAYSCCSPYHHEYVYRLPTLSSEQSLELFCRRLFGRPGSTCPPNLKGLSEDIVSKCGRLPLAIVTIASLLASKPNKTREEWQNTHDRLGVELDSNPSLHGIKYIINLSYNDLPYHLKRCFLYLSIFSENYKIRRKRVQRLWMAEGFVEGHRGMTAMEVAESYFNELIGRSMILPSEINEYEKVKTYRVHDIMLEFLVSKSMEENFVYRLGEHNSVMPQDVVRRLSVHANSSEGNTMNLSHVRSLTMFGGGRPSLVMRRMRLLRVLDLEACRYVEDHHLKIVGKLYHLRYLNLRKTSVSTLPESLQNLQSLETLDLRDCNFLRKLPTVLCKLKQLHCLLVGGIADPPKLIRGIGRLRVLHVLALIDIEQSAQVVVKDLGKLHQLRKLGVTGVTKTNATQFFASLEKVSSSLRSLELRSQFGPTYDDAPLTSLDSVLSPPLLLRSLKVHGHLGKLPCWAHLLTNVVKILLHGTGLGNDAITVLQTLPNLIQLELELDSYIGEQLCFGGGFISLKALHLVWLKELRSLRFENRSMPSLELLFIDYCYLLREEGSLGIEHLARLKKIVVRYMPRDVVGTLQRAANTHPNHPKFINHNP